VSVALVHQQAPDSATVAEIDAAFEASSGQIALAVLGLWRAWHATLLSSPTKWAAAGDYSEDYTETVKNVKEHVRRLELEAGVGLAVAGVSDLPTMGRSALARRGRYRTDCPNPRSTRTTTSTTSSSASLTDDILAAIAEAIARAQLTVRVHDPVDLVDNVALVLTNAGPNLTTANALETAVLVDIEDSTGNVITSGVAVTKSGSDVTLEASPGITGLKVTVLGNPPTTP